MLEQVEIVLYRLRFLTGGLFVLVSLLLLVFIVSGVVAGNTVQAASTNPPATSYDNPNVITNGAVMAKDALGRNVRATAGTINRSLGSAGSAMLHTSASAAHSVTGASVTVAKGTLDIGVSVAQGAFGVTTSAAKITGKGLLVPVRATAHVASSVSHFSVGSFIEPAEDNSNSVPVIDSVDTGTPSAQPAPSAAPLAALTPAPAPTDTEAVWPIHGAITTEFGVPHWPYQPTHTGLDISDGASSGVTPVRPFKPGRVIEATYSSSGFGNHVIIDHGGGVTSLYGHMASLSVQTGQAVTKDTVLGREGSTGASTGTHLHFEVRLNGQPVDPRRYVSGHP